MRKRILIIGYNFTPEPTGIGKYSGEMVDWLASKGHDCSVITTYPYYPYWKVQEPYAKDRFWYKKEIKDYDSNGRITIYRCPMYVPKNPTGGKRMLLDLSFMMSSFIILLKMLFQKKFDTVMVVVPSFQFGLLGCFYKAFRKTKLVYHIHDFQIEAAQDLKMIKSESLIRILFRVEKYIFRKSDIISSVSEKMVSKIEEKSGKEVFLFPNWSDTNFFKPLHDKEKLKIDFGFSPKDKIVLYSGAIGEKQGLEAIVHAAEKFKDNAQVKFLICGSGPYKEKLQTLSEKRSLDNVIFFPLQPKDKFNQFLNMADVHLVIQKAIASDLVMPSKLTTILSVGGLALITANKGTGLHSLVDKYNMGILVDAENQNVLNEGLEKSLIIEDKKQIMDNARTYAEKYLDRDVIMKRFDNIV